MRKCAEETEARERTAGRMAETRILAVDVKLKRKCSDDRWRLERSEVGGRREKRLGEAASCIYSYTDCSWRAQSNYSLYRAQHAPPAHPDRDVAPLTLNPFGRGEEMVLRQGGNGVETVAWG